MMKINVKVDNQIFEVEIDDLHSRPILTRVDGKTFEVWLEEAAEAYPVATAAAPVAASPAPGAPNAPQPKVPTPAVSTTAPTTATGGSNVIASPLPGIVTAIAVREGEEVKAGQELLTLEAMKMKNSIRATHDGKVAAIRVNVGDQVRHNQTLIEFTV